MTEKAIFPLPTIATGNDPKDFPVRMEAFTRQLVFNMEAVRFDRKVLHNRQLIMHKHYLQAWERLRKCLKIDENEKITHSFVLNFFGAGRNSLPAVKVRDSLKKDWFGEIPKPTVKVWMEEEKYCRIIMQL